jgi:ubiquinone/menaquinone biosynthesis C-methylase UbiE
MLGLMFSSFILLQHHQGAAHTFEDVARWAREFEDPARDEWQKPAAVVGALGLRPGHRVADIGAGSGYFSRRFAEVVGDQGVVFAVDIEPNMLRYLSDQAEKTGRENILPVLGAPGSPMLPLRSVDVVFICNTVHHVEERPRYYQKLRRALVPGGRLVIVDFEKRDLPVGPPAEMKIAAEALIQEVTAAGFVLKERKNLLPYQYFLIFENP